MLGVALGGFLGIVGGVTAQALQSRFTAARERRKWTEDNRKEEYRELLKTLTQTATFLMEHIGTSASQDDAHRQRFRQVYGDGLRVIADRIFIAQEIKDARIYDRWKTALEALNKSRDIHAFSDAFDGLSGDIVKLALEGKA